MKAGRADIGPAKKKQPSAGRAGSFSWWRLIKYIHSLICLPVTVEKN
jgi:hypothetical protein